MTVPRAHRLVRMIFTVAVQDVQRDGRVGVGPAGAHLGRDPYRLHDLLVARALAPREACVAGDAVRTLGDVRDCDRDELLGLFWQRSLGEDRRAELLERLVGLRREFRRRLPIEAVAFGYTDSDMSSSPSWSSLLTGLWARRRRGSFSACEVPVTSFMGRGIR